MIQNVILEEVKKRCGNEKWFNLRFVAKAKKNNEAAQLRIGTHAYSSIIFIGPKYIRFNYAGGQHKGSQHEIETITHPDFADPAFDPEIIIKFCVKHHERLCELSDAKVKLENDVKTKTMNEFGLLYEESN